MKPIHLRDYTVCFNETGYEELATLLDHKKYSCLYILTDSNTQEHCLPRFLSLLETEIPIEVLEIEPGEEHKTIETCIGLWETLAEYNADRKSAVINLGGGVITDMGGFTASVFKRGIDFIHIPTSLLAMVDAALGGKNGVDLGILKNQVGCIIPPQLVLIDPEYLATLPAREMRCGLAEMLKHGLIASSGYWQQLQNLAELDMENLNQLIYDSVKIKCEITEQDPYEKGIRKILNFGHTLGHAIESYLLLHEEKPAVLHGEAIAAGMILESHISMQNGYLTLSDFDVVKKNITAIFGVLNFSHEDQQKIIHLLVHDKKNEYGKILFVLLKKIGEAVYNQEISKEQIFKAFHDYQF